MTVPTNQIDLPFGDGLYHFALPLPLINELQIKAGPIGAIFARLMRGRYVDQGGNDFGNPEEAEYKAEDVNDTIRLCLIGGGFGIVNDQKVAVDAHRADQLCRAYLELMPYSARWKLAFAIMGAVMEGYTPPTTLKPPKKKTGPGKKTTDPSTTPPP